VSAAAARAYAAFSMGMEVRVAVAVVAAACLLPVLAVLVLTQAGFSLVSGALASQDPQTHQVELRDPATGKVSSTVGGPFEWPISGKVTLEFGQPDPPYQPLHTGIDIAGPVGDPVRAFMKGTVTYAGSEATGFGTHVVLDNGGGVTSTYGHMNTLAVQAGQAVDIGTVLGTRGSTGWSTGPHLHFQIDVYGLPVDPRTFLEGNP